MVERNSFVTVANDDQLNEGYFNGVYYGNRILTYDETTDLNVSASSSGTTSDSNNKDFTFTSTQLQGASYIEIIMTGKFTLSAPGTSSTTTNASVSLNASITAPSADSIYNQALITGSGAEGHESYDNLPSVTLVHKLSASEKSSGITINLAVTASATRSGTGANSTSSWTNVSTTFSTRY